MGSPLKWFGFLPLFLYGITRSRGYFVFTYAFLIYIGMQINQIYLYVNKFTLVISFFLILHL